MAHLVETMAYAGETPWHGLGVRVEDNLNTDEMLAAAGLDWEVEKKPLFFEHNGENVPSGTDALIRSSDGKLLDTVSGNWNPVQNQEAFDFFAEFVDSGQMEMHTAGSLDGGRIVWALAKINDSFEAVKGDVVDNYFLFTNPHRYGKALNVRSTQIRVVCWNTLNFALKGDSELNFTMNHVRRFDAEVAKEALGLADVRFHQYEERAKYLTTRYYDEESLLNFFKEVFPVQGENKEVSASAKKVIDCVHTQAGAEFAEGTWWQAFNAVTYASDHVLGHSQDTRLKSSWYGTNRLKKVEALEKALEYANAS